MLIDHKDIGTEGSEGSEDLVEEAPEVLLAKLKILFIGCTSLLKISTRERLQSSPSHGTSSAPNVKAKVERMAL